MRSPPIPPSRYSLLTNTPTHQTLNLSLKAITCLSSLSARNITMFFSMQRPKVESMGCCRSHQYFRSNWSTECAPLSLRCSIKGNIYIFSLKQTQRRDEDTWMFVQRRPKIYMLEAGTSTCLQVPVEPLNKAIGTLFLKYIRIMNIITYYEKSFY